MKKMCIPLITIFLSLFIFFSFPLQAEIKLPAIFGDNMVLQQQSDVAVWGWAKPNSSVKVSSSWNGKSYSAKSNTEGYWKVKIKTPEAGYKTYTLTISDGKAITLHNILIGEVWVCSGQSNMELPMRGGYNEPIEGGPEAILNSKNSNIRCFSVQKKSTITPQEDCVGTWEMANPETVPNFTATGYFFGRLLNRILDIPIGLIHSSWGGSSIEAWMSPESIKEIPEKVPPTSDEEIQIPFLPATVLYNGMIRPILGYGIRGAIWYQGETNRGEPDLYVKMFDTMVRDWRDRWEMGEFPFYYCQIAPYEYGGGLNSGYIREAQAKGMETTPNTGMAVLMDANSKYSIHPAKKKDAGERMALWALAKTYGMDKIQYRSPEVKSVTMEGRVAIVLFDYVGANGLTSYGKDIENFQIAGKDRRFHPAKAVLTGNSVYLFSPYVAEPVAIRYCFDDTSNTEIFTVEGNLPLSSFRTDDW